MGNIKCLSDPAEIQRLVNKQVEAERAIYSSPVEHEPCTGEIPSDEIMEYLDRNQDGDAGLLARLLKNRFVFDHAAGRWYIFNGNFWQEDLTGEALQSVGKAAAIYEFEYQRQVWLRLKAIKEHDKHEENSCNKNMSRLINRIKLLQSLKWKRDILVLACSGKETLGITGQEWDKLDMELACANGVINLKDGSLRQGMPEDYIKTMAPIEWKGIDEPCPAWVLFLAEVFGDNVTLVDFIQRLFGSGIIGRVIHHIIVILWGIGRNGKGTMLETLRFVLGDYALKTESEILLEQKNARQAGAPNSAVLSLRGKRIVWASETSDSGKLNVAKVKELVGGDTLNARGIYGKHHIQFEPSHLLLLLTNHKPIAPANDYALWQRIILVPFERSFVENPEAPHESKSDLYLIDKLKAEASGILAWLVRGCITFRKEGLNPPDCVKVATKEYRKEEDLIERFLNDRCVTGQTYETQAGILYKVYQSWAEEMGLKPISGIKFGKEISQRFDSYQKRHVYYIGLSLNTGQEGD